MTASDRPLHLGSPVDSAWGDLPPATTVHPDGTASNDGDGNTPDAGDGVGSGDRRSERTPTVVVVRMDDDSINSRSEGTEATQTHLERLRDRYPEVPILVYTVDDDVDIAIDAGRVGVEYVSGRRLEDDGETLTERIRTLGDDRVESGPPLSSEFLERFIRITADRGTDLEETLDALLSLGREQLDLPIGFAAQVDGSRFDLIDQQGADGLLAALAEGDRFEPDATLPLATTYCRRTIEDGGVMSLTEASAQGWHDDPAYETFGLETYIGGRVAVEDRVVGTFCFADENPRTRPFTTEERLFVELLADWFGGAFERKRAREERAEAVDRLERTLERIDDGFFALDDEWRFTYLNDAAATMLEAPADELSGAHVFEEFPDALGKRYEQYYREAMETQESVSFEEYYAPLDLWTDVTAYPSDGGLSVFFRDITERKRREEALKNLLQTTERLQFSDGKRAVAEHLVGAIDGILGHSINGVRLYDPDGDVLEVVARTDEVTELFGDRPTIAPGEGPIGRAFKLGRRQVQRSPAELDADRDYGDVRSLIAVPLSEHGVVSVGSTATDAFDEWDVSVVQLLATNAAAAMDRIDRENRLHTYERVLETVDDMVCVLDGEDVVYATQPLTAWLDSSRSDLIGTPITAQLPPPAAARVSDGLDALEDDGEETIEITVGRSNGSPRRGRIRLSPLPSQPGQVVATIDDITELTRTRTALDHERDRFHRLFEQIPDPIMEVEHLEDDTVVRSINEAFTEQFGYEPAAIEDESIRQLDLRYGTPDERGEPSIDERVREEGVVIDQLRRRTVDGPREFLFRGFVYESASTTRAFGIYTDITEQKHRGRYLQVTNRILRHNLRNELNVVFGFASEIARIAEDEAIVDYARRIETTGRNLAGLAEGAAEIKRFIDRGPATDLAPVEVAPIVDRIAETARDRHPSATIVVDVPASATVRANDDLDTALEELVENALEHGGDSPRVVITGTVEEPSTDPGHRPTLTLVVADDGPGIPDSVAAVVTGEGEITQLQHNSGIGLWLVAWIIEGFGGDLTFGPGPDGSGTAATIRLPTAE